MKKRTVSKNMTLHDTIWILR